MYAVIKAGGKQYRVSEGDVVETNRLQGNPGDKLTLSDVMMVTGDKGTVIGSPLVKSASVTAEIVEHFRGDKVLIFKKKRRHNYRRKNGHRQDLTRLKILGIKAQGDKNGA